MSSLTGFQGFGGENIPAGYTKGSMNNFTPEQMQLFKQSFANVGPGSLTSQLARGDQTAFDELEAPAMRQFQQLQGDIGSRFSGMGMGARKGSGFQNTMNQATQDFASNLQSQRLQLRQQAIQDLMGMSNQLLGQRPYDNFMVKNQQNPSMLQSLVGVGAPIAGAALGAFAGGPMGMAAGAQMGSQLGSAFGGYQAPESDWTGISKLPSQWS